MSKDTFTPFEGNLSKAHKQSKKAKELLDEGLPELAMAQAAVGFLHVFIELTAQIRDYVKSQTHE